MPNNLAIINEEITEELSAYKLLAHSIHPTDLELTCKAISLTAMAKQCWEEGKGSDGLQESEAIDRVKMIFEVLEKDTPSHMKFLTKAFSGCGDLDVTPEARQIPLGTVAQDIIQDMRNTLPEAFS